MGRYEFSIIDIIPYFAAAIALTFITISKGDNRRKGWYCMVLMFLLAAIRYGIGYDYYNYKKAVLHELTDNALDRFEPLSRMMMELAHFTHYQVFFILGSLLTIIPVYIACKKLSINPAFSLLIYFLYPSMYLSNLSIVRNAVAFSLVFLAIALNTERKVFKSFILILIASLFHKVAIVGFLIYPIYWLRKRFGLHVVIYVISFFISAIVIVFIGKYSDSIAYLSIVEHYLEDKDSEGGKTMTIIVNVIGIANLLLWKKTIQLNHKNEYYSALLNTGICLWNIFIGIQPVLAGRLSTFFIQSLILLVPCYQYCFERKHIRLVRKVILLFFFTLYTSSFVINISSYLKDPSDRMSFIPYQTVFDYNDYSNYIY